MSRILIFKHITNYNLEQFLAVLNNKLNTTYYFAIIYFISVGL